MSKRKTNFIALIGTLCLIGACLAVLAYLRHNEKDPGAGNSFPDASVAAAWGGAQGLALPEAVPTTILLGPDGAPISAPPTVPGLGKPPVAPATAAPKAPASPRSPAVPKPGNGTAPLNSAGNNTINVVSWNTLVDNSTANVVAEVRSLVPQADVLGLQELSDKGRRAALRQAVVDCSGCPYATHMPESNQGGKVPILWKAARFTLVDQGSERATNETRVEDGAGGTNAAPKYLVWVKLRENVSGRSFFVINTHFLPTVERSGVPNADKPARLAIYNTHMNALVAMIDRLAGTGSPVLITGDFNVDARADARVKSAMFPSVRLAAHNTVSNWQSLNAPSAGSHGKRLIDYVWATRSSTVVPVAQSILAKSGSDHSPVLVTFSVKR